MSSFNCTNDTTILHVFTEGEFSLPSAILFGIPASLIILVTVIGNLLVLCLKAKVGKSQTTMLIWNLGLADFLVGIIVLPMGVTTVIRRKWMFGRFLCRLWVSCDVIFCTASIVTLCVISLDRYIGVTRPLRYKSIVTKRRVSIAITCIWIFSVAILLGTVKYHPSPCIPAHVCHVGNELRYVVHSVIVAFFFPSMVTLGLYWKIYKIAVQREKGLRSGMMMFMGQNLLKECVPTQMRIHCGGTINKQRNVIRMHKTVAKTLGVVVTAFLFCWLPFFSLYLISYHCDACIPPLALDVTTWLGYCNSMINPVIYAFTIGEYRETLKKTFSLATRGLVVKKEKTFPNGALLPRTNRAYSVSHSGIFSSGGRNVYGKKQKAPDRSPERKCAVPEPKLHFEYQFTAKAYCLLISPKATGL